jgi:Polyketide cyclase / dehydrase and lipid transport
VSTAARRLSARDTNVGSSRIGMACGAGIGHRVDDEDCRSIVGGASAAEAWELRANRFGEIGQWTNVVDSSELVGDRVDVGAERHCRVSGRGSRDGLAIERVTAFDPGAMTIAYELVRGPPAFITSARNVMTVTALSEDRCRVDADGAIPGSSIARQRYASFMNSFWTSSRA